MLRVKELLRRFQIVVYTGNKWDDLVLMELELDDLYEEKLIEKEEYLTMKTILKSEMGALKRSENETI
ncbi:YqgQ family protein [Fodinisporobacter ferrooxydans]|uniref:YqgQ family protein n=1 Tax=Fodinisporobacter ferrooxydans TaxID=2901836 RepID=A0ABY4CJD4_9BACL|nr:YqgQ family protein [Alicyclobacillaceae bacterium MYW30-H2]